MSWRIIPILFSLLFGPTLGWGQDPDVLVQQASSELDFELKFAKAVLRISEEINLIDPTGEKILQYAGDNLPAPLDKPTFELFDLYAKHYLTQPLPEKAVRKLKGQLKWSAVKKIIKQSTIGADVFFKKKGMGISIALILGMCTEYTMYFILFHVNPALLPISAAIPYGTTYAFFPGFFRKIKEKKELIKVLGSKEAFEAYSEQKKIALKNLHLKNPDSILLPLKEVDGIVEAAVIPRTLWWRNIIQWMGLSKDSLTYSSLNLFLLTRFENDEVLRTIRDLPELNNDQKTAMMLRHLYASGDEKLLLSLKQKFGEAFTQIRQRPTTPGLKEWTQSMMKASSREDILSGLKNVPSQANPKEVSIIWKDILLPSYIENMSMSYFQARRMIEKFVSTQAILENQVGETMDREAIHHLALYVERVWDKNIRSCSNSAPIIFRKLLMF